VLDFGVAKMKVAGEAAVYAAPPMESVSRRTMDASETETVVMAAPPEAGEAETVAMLQTPVDPSSGAFGSDGGQTMPGSLVGTPGYMSPEQALGGEIDFRSDIYSLAVVAYSLVCGRLPFTGKTSQLIEFHRSGTPPPPAGIASVPHDVSDTVLAGLARDPAARPASAIEFARRFHNAVDAEFFALRRSRAFLLQHLGTFALLMAPIYGVLLSAVALVGYYGRKLIPGAVERAVLVPLTAAVLLVFADNLLRATAALIAMDERVRLRRFVFWRVFWKLVKSVPALAATQFRSPFLFGPGWVTGDCLWPVLCVVERLRGREAVMRSRRLMTGLNSAGRALAIRHLALAALAIGGVLEQFGTRVRIGQHASGSDSSTWFPIFAIFAASPLFLYDRTAARDEGPLLELNRTPEVRVTARPLSVSSMVWLAIGIIYLIYEPVKLWLFGPK